MAEIEETLEDFERALRVAPIFRRPGEAPPEPPPFATSEPPAGVGPEMGMTREVRPRKPFATSEPPVGASPEMGMTRDIRQQGAAQPPPEEMGPMDYRTGQPGPEEMGPPRPVPFATPEPPPAAGQTGIERPDLYPQRRAAPPAPVSAPVEAPPESAPVEAQEASARNLAGAPTPEAAELPRVGQAEAKEEEKQKSFGEMLKKLAEKVGVPLLHLIQAGAYGYGGINKPTVLERLKEQQAERKKTEEGRAWDAKIRQIDRDFAERMGEIQRQYQWEVMNAQNEQEKAMAEYNAQRQMEVARFQAEEAYKRAELAAQNQAAGKAPSKADFGKALGIK